MNTTVVYLDKLFLGNLLVNWAILWSAGRLSQVRASHFRILAGASLGGVYSVALFLPGVDYLFSFYAKFAVSLLMVAAAFAPLPPRRFILCLAFFYLVSFALGGLVMGMSYFFSSTAVPGQMSSYFKAVSRHLWPGLAVALLFLLTSVAVLPGYFKNRQGIEAMKMPVTICINGRKVTVRGLVDTGNSLCDPVSGEPVVVVEHSAIKDVLPGPMKEIEAFAGDAVSVIESMMNTPWSGRLRLIPFQSLGSEHGILLGIKPDSVEFVRDSRLQKVEKVVIGIHGRRLDAGEEYNALINPSLLERAIPA
ncbi:MAG: sigma-E processing peptidase SpoIIGA [Bacillota bacterium]